MVTSDRVPWRVSRPVALGESTSADVYVYDVIGGGGWFDDGVSASDFAQTIAGLHVDELNVFVNSPGGDVYDGIAMVNALTRHPAYVTVTVDGLAASAASLLLTAADNAVMGANSELMIHDAWSRARGNAQDMRDAADQLDRVSDNIASMYAQHAGGTAADWRDIMRQETWYTAAEAVEAGLAHAVVDPPAADTTEPADAAPPRPAGEPAAASAGGFVYASRADAPAPPLERIAAMRRRSSDLQVVATVTTHGRFVPTRPEPGNTPQDVAPIKEEGIMGDQVTETPAPAMGPTIDYEALAGALGKVMAQHEPMPAFSASPGVPASLAVANQRPELSYAQAMAGFAARASGLAPVEMRERLKSTLTDGTSVFAALTDVSFGDATSGGIGNTNPPQWIGELVDRVPYVGLWDLVAHADLTSPNVTGFTMATAPTGGKKSDGGAAVTSTGAKWSPVTVTASRWAGADSFDRMAFDFGIQASALDGYFRAQLYNYFVARDAALLTSITSGITATAAEAVPTGSSITPLVNQILDGVGTVLSQKGGVANLAVLNTGDFKGLLKNSREQAPAFLTLDLGALTQGDVSGRLTVRPDLTGTITSGDVLVGNGVGVTGYELPGSPVRAEQVQVSVGNIDVGLFGYYAAIRQSANFFTLVSAAA